MISAKIFLSVLIFIGIILMSAYWFNQQKLKTDVRLACREYIKRHLHDPDSAQFEDYRDYYVSQPWPEKNNAVFVAVAVRAKNLMGALRRQQYRCMAEPNNNVWVPVSLEEMGSIIPRQW